MEMNGTMVVSKPLYVALAERKEDRRARLQVLSSPHCFILNSSIVEILLCLMSVSLLLTCASIAVAQETCVYIRVRGYCLGLCIISVGIFRIGLF